MTEHDQPVSDERILRSEDFILIMDEDGACYDRPTGDTHDVSRPRSGMT